MTATGYCLLPYGRELAERYWPMARRVADDLARRYPFAEEDVRSAAVFGFLSAVARFDPARGVNFATFAHAGIRLNVGSALRSARRQKRDWRRRVGLEFCEALFVPPAPDPDRPDGGPPPSRPRWEPLTAFGETKSPDAWAKDRRCRVSSSTFRRRLHEGQGVEEALTVPACGVEAFGEWKTFREWEADPRCVVSRPAIHRRLAAGKSPEDALTRPPCRSRRREAAPA